LQTKIKLGILKSTMVKDLFNTTKKDGKYEAYRVGSGDIIDSGEWKINVDGTYHEKTDGKWKGKIR